MKPQHPPIEHSAQFSRRNLFPSEDNSGSDLGLISPINFDSDTEISSLNDKCVGDYDILGLLEKNTTVETPNNTQVFPQSTDVFTPSTSDESPTQKLKTPHDTSDNSKFPKLIRKTLVDTSFQDSCVNPKIRTALFPDIDMSLPSRTFYPKKQSQVSLRVAAVKRNLSPRRSNKQRGLYLCGRRSQFRSGQINAGVRHKIKKPKLKKISKLAALEAAINIIENSPLNSFLNDSTEAQEAPFEYSELPPSLPPQPPSRDPTPSPEPDPNKKFFKSSRHKGVININSNIKIEMNNGKMNLLTGNSSNKAAPKRRLLHEENKGNSCKKIKLTADFGNEKLSEQPLISENYISDIINALEDEKENQAKNGIDPMTLMSPTSQMCNMTSGLALNSPKKARDLRAVLEEMPSDCNTTSNNNKEKKLFPVFYPGKTVIPAKPEIGKLSNSFKKFKGLSKDQMLLDAGQKRFGATQCPECKIIYHMGDPGDEIMHLNYHNAEHIFRFNGWKNERVVSGDLYSGRIVQIVPNDPKVWWKKVKEVMQVVNRDLGYYDIEFNTANSQIFFYIQNKVIVGALVAELKTSAHKLLTTHEDQVDLCSEEAYPIKCGVSRIWVAHNHRKKGVATALMNALKRNFIHGYILRDDDIAFSSPTTSGKIFGQKYFKTPNFLIYFV